MLETVEHRESKLKSSTVTSDAGAEPLTLPYTKSWLKVEHDADDDIITNLIKSVREQCSKILNLDLKLVTRIAEFYELQQISELPDGPHGNVLEVKLTDESGAETTLTAGQDYRVLGYTYKSIQLFTRPASSTMLVEFESGYTASNIPETLRFLMLRTLADNYEQREQIVTGAITAVINADALNIAKQYKRRDWF